MQVEAPSQNGNNMDAKSSSGPGGTAPLLSHRMKHDKSILALAVSSHYIFAGTQGGEILVGREPLTTLELAWLIVTRSTTSRRTSVDEPYTHTEEVSSVSAYRKIESSCSRVLQIQSLM